MKCLVLVGTIAALCAAAPLSGGHGRGEMSVEFAAVPSAAIERVAGGSRVETAVAVSRRLFAEGGCRGSALCAKDEGTEVVVVASATSYADAAAGVPLAALEGGPLLLTFLDRLPRAVTDEVRRLAPRRVVVVGGELAVSDGVVDALRDTGVGQVERIGGSDRYATAAGVAGRFPAGAGVFVAAGDVAGDGWQAALLASATAASARRPLLLVATDDVLPAATVGALAEVEATAAVVVLRHDALPPGVFEQLRAAVGVVNASSGTGARTDWWTVSAAEADRARLLATLWRSRSRRATLATPPPHSRSPTLALLTPMWSRRPSVRSSRMRTPSPVLLFRRGPGSPGSARTIARRGTSAGESATVCQRLGLNFLSRWCRPASTCGRSAGAAGRRD